MAASQWQGASSPAGRGAGSGPPADPPSAPLAVLHTAAEEEQQLAAQQGRPLQGKSIKAVKASHTRLSLATFQQDRRSESICLESSADLYQHRQLPFIPQ